MSFTRNSAAQLAKSDLAGRLNVDVTTITQRSISDEDFPDMSLGAGEKGEMSAQMISSGWRISLGVKGKTYEYRADKYQLRLRNFDGENHVIES